MNLFDMIVGDESAQIQASERLTEAVKGYEKTFQRYINNDIDHEGLAGEVSIIDGQLNEARQFVGTAVMEPRFWRPNFNSILFEDVVATYKILCTQILKVSKVLEDDKQFLLDSLPSFSQLREQMFLCLNETSNISLACVAHDEQGLASMVNKKVKSDSRIIDMLVADMNSQTQPPPVKDRDGEMHVLPDSRRCATATMIQSMMNGMRNLQLKSVSEKNML
ncbi:unnamed protein product [Effrenium voratum]|nr:unnamed protein product [Effrenium voratum]